MTVLKIGIQSQWIKMLAIKLDDLNFISGTHTAEGENYLLQLIPDLHTCAMAGTGSNAHAYVCVHMHAHVHCIAF